MKMKKFTLDPVSYQNRADEENFNNKLFGATHVETYTKDEGKFGGLKTLIIFAFYPDEEEFEYQITSRSS